MQNDEIAKVLDEIADMLELSGENFFRVRAYRNAARAIHDQPVQVAELTLEQIDEIPGNGADLAGNGLFRGESIVAGETVKQVYRALKLPWIAPELREDRGEIEAASSGGLPNLVESADLRGDLHTHSTWSQFD